MALDITRIYDTKADSIFVLMDEKLTTCVKDPGLGRPWSTTNLKLAETTAKQISKNIGGKPVHVKTLSDAIKLLIGQHVQRN
jgi:hypothetical protein